MKVIKYNANTKNEFIGDCAPRALSLAYGMPYEEVKTILEGLAQKLHIDSYNKTKVLSSFFLMYPFEEVEQPNINVVEFVKNHPIGTYVLWLEFPEGYHLTCLIDSNIYDTWDCSNGKILYAYLIDSEKTNRELPV